MRMNVVLPLPLGPRKPQISPCADLQIDVIDGREVAEALGHSAHIDGEIVSHRSRTRIPRPPAGPDAGSPPTLGSKTASTMKTSLLRLSRL